MGEERGEVGDEARAGRGGGGESRACGWGCILRECWLGRERTFENVDGRNKEVRFVLLGIVT